MDLWGGRQRTYRAIDIGDVFSAFGSQNKSFADAGIDDPFDSFELAANHRDSILKLQKGVHMIGLIRDPNDLDTGWLSYEVLGPKKIKAREIWIKNGKIDTTWWKQVPVPVPNK
ncbi:MAG: hypothetical protein BroJett042_27810 [Bacteroidota bacterium]|nr:MAG: hypothetical protein BroJett042_27810 [Bacteroidota bacterium]